MPSITIPNVSICDLNKLCNKLLNKITTPANLNSSVLKPILVFSSLFIFLIKSFRLKSFKESLILTLILASSFSTEIYGDTISLYISFGILLYKTAISRLCSSFLFKFSATLKIDPKERTFPISGRESI